MVAAEDVHLDCPSVLRVHALAKEVGYVIRAAGSENDLPVSDSHLSIRSKEQIVVAQVAVNDCPGWRGKSILDGNDLRSQPLGDRHCAGRQAISKVACEVLPAIVI